MKLIQTELEPHPRHKTAWQLLKFDCQGCELSHTMSFAVEKNGNLGVAIKAGKTRSYKFKSGKQRNK